MTKPANKLSEALATKQKRDWLAKANSINKRIKKNWASKSLSCSGFVSIVNKKSHQLRKLKLRSFAFRFYPLAIARRFFFLPKTIFQFFFTSLLEGLEVFY